MRILIVILLMLACAPCVSWALADPVSQSSRKVILHTVQKGETLSSILKSYNLSLEKFLKSNRQFEGTDLSLSLGQQLVINKKDIGSGVDSEIAHNIRIYLEARGISTKPEELAPATKEKKAELMKELHTVSKYSESAASTKIIPWSDVLKVAMLLPLTKNDGSSDKDYEAFYKGAILAMSQLKTDGISLDVDVYDTGHTVEGVQSLLYNGVLKGRNLVIGPVYKEQFATVANAMRNKGSVLVSPLATVEMSTDGNVFQLAPSQTSRYDKLNDFFVGKNVIFCSSGNDDTSFLQSIQQYVDKAGMITIVTRDITEEELRGHFSTTTDNIVVVSAKNKGDIELILSKIATSKRALSSNYKIAVLGSPEFAKVEDNKKDDFFKANTYFVTSYHQDRLNEGSLVFETQYIEMFGELPNLFSYRAYDAVMLFVSAMYESGKDFNDYPFDQLMRILQVGYRFAPENGHKVNQEWMLVNYAPDYTIITK